MTADGRGAMPRDLSTWMLQEVTKAIGLITRDAEPTQLFAELLDGLLGLTESDYGYIGEVLFDEGAPYLRTWAITDISWNAETQALYEQFAVEGQGLEFRNLDTLFGWGLRDGGRLVICNDPRTDPRSSGRPEGHPPLNSYLAIPVFRGPELVGQVGVANRKGGYDEALVSGIEPFVVAVGSLIDAYRTDRDRRRAEAERTALQNRQAAILANINDLVAVIKPDGAGSRLHFGRRADAYVGGRRLLGYPDELSGNIESIVHPDDLQHTLEAFVEASDGRRPPDTPVLLRIMAADGRYRNVEMAVQDLRHDPSVDGYLVTLHDVTVLRRAEQAARDRSTDLGTLIDALRDAVLLVDDRFEVVYMNQAFADVWGYRRSPVEMVGAMTEMDRWLQARPAEASATGGETPNPMSVVQDPASFAAGIESVYAGGRPELGVRVPMANGSVLERDYLPVEHGDGRRWHLWIYHDVTEQTRLEEERATLLEQEREQNRSLRELDRLKTDFVETVSHELRTPLTSIVSFAGLLSDDADQLPVEQREFVEIIGRNANRLLDLVGDLLLIAQLESGGLSIEPKPSSLARLVEEVVAAFRPEYEAKRQAVTLDLSTDEQPALVDPGRFEQVVRNLVSNAIKFTPEGGRLRISTRRETGQWVFEVGDTGIGIPADEVDRLFDRFFRSSTAVSRGIPGSGLGLAIVRAIVDLHGGSLTVTSSTRGTTIGVVLPDSSTEQCQHRRDSGAS